MEKNLKVLSQQSMNNQPLISIITPNYNSQTYIAETIESIINQSYGNWELLITDDVSSDNSVEIIKNYSNKDSRIKFFQLQENGGAAVCRNNSIKQASGRFIAFLDSDDIWLPNKLQHQLNFMVRNNYELTYTRYQKIDKKSNKIEWFSKNWGKLAYKDMLSSNKMGCLSVMYDTKRIGKVYMPLIRKRQDYALWLDILKKVDFSYCLDEVLALYRVSDSSLSSSKKEMLKWNWKLFREVEKLSLLKSIYSVLNNIYFKIKYK